MTIIYYDGGKLKCSEIEVVDDGLTLIADGVYLVPIAEVLRIMVEE